MTAIDFCQISNLYWNHTAKGRVDNQNSWKDKIQRKVRYGCVLFWLLLNVYNEKYFSVIRFNRCTTYLFADDTMIMTENNIDLHNVMKRLNACAIMNKALKSTWRKLNVWPSLNRQFQTSTGLVNEEIERKDNYKYFETWITSNINQTKEIKTRIEITLAAFLKLYKFLLFRDISFWNLILQKNPTNIMSG